MAGSAAWATFAPQSQLWGRIITRGPADGPSRVALTFDDGPMPGATDRILDTLADLRVKAAFFVTGREAERHPALVRRMADEGHLVANHSFDHAPAGFLRGPWFWRRQIARTDAAIERATGQRPRLFRPPLGIKTPPILWAAAREGHVTVNWTRRAFDGVSTTAQQVLDRLVPHTRPGEILVLHDGVSPQSRRDPKATVEAIRPLIEGLRGRGIEPVRLDELAGAQPYRTVTD
ncbi:MAG TPA: polysaccharide deacetylase family protein [Tepidisphaeraceae bacterium]